MTDATDTPRTCPGCDEAVGPGAYCERCGTEIEPASEPTERSGGMLVLGAPTSAVDTAEPAPADDERCECGGAFLDGYCEQCGSPRPDPRAHLTRDEQWVAGVTDIGVRRSANQDAFALTATDGTAAGVVCDGVGSAAFSEEASQAAADAALEVLTRTTSTGVGVPSSLVPALTARLVAATDAAADAVADVTERLLGPAGVGGGDTSAANPSCTLVAAVVSGATVVVGSVGDSRAYWIP
ncbi:MAG: protein phosphatase 2C domain-containing protein, partial [Mobilicoccus sp.]|nr:protein phosphatase 2C domain-containing protein [Mobilicoccus sp.]